jgi:acyl-ACP thioesterase
VILDLRGRPVRIPPDFGLHFQNPEIDGEILRVAADGAVAGRPFRLTVRPHDLDPLGHANNAAYLEWLEEALVADGDTAERAGILPRSVRLEYLASAGPGDELEIATRQAGGEWQARILRTDGTVVLRASGGAR